ncbi:hypothetical protein GF312_21300 [Candidatus Poribacteria bacterium]|nr:hypothetical protein [Candidatus Poribacteria bacterium]
MEQSKFNLGQDKRSVGVTWRALLIGIILIPINVYWIMDSGGQGYPTTVSLYFNVIFCVFLLIILNHITSRIFPKLSFSQGELLAVYVMLSVSSSIAGHDMMRVLSSMPAHPFWYATPENEWQELFHRYIPTWLSVSDKNMLNDYFKGDSSFYSMQNLKFWLKPVLWWSSFVFCLLFVMLCVNTIVRRQWTEQEKLSYPIIQLPLEMTTSGGIKGLMLNKLMWIGFGLAAVVDIINGLNFLYPSVPSIGGKLYDLRPFFTTKPWDAIGWTPVAVFPFAIGIAFFIPLDLSFSCWFFYLFWKVQRILGSILGLRSLPRFPYIEEQAFGAYMGLFVIAIWATRKHLMEVIKKFSGIKSRVDDTKEPLPYRWAVLGLIVAFAYLVGFCYVAGMSIWVAVLFFVIYYAISTAICRMRAELGSPVHDLHFIGPDQTLPKIFGTRHLGAANLTMFAYLYFFNRAYRGHPMPHQLEGFKLAERTGMNSRRLLIAMVISVPLAALASFWAHLDISYRVGAPAWFAWEPFNRLQSFLSAPQPPDYGAIVASNVGFITTILLMFMRVKFFWWPFHPAGYAVSSSWSMNVFWFSIMLSFFAKYIIMKSGGIKTHRKAIPFFLGLILGEFIVGSVWSIIGVSMHRPMYRFLY